MVNGKRRVWPALVIALGVGGSLLCPSVARCEGTTASPPSMGGKVDGIYGPHLPPDISTHGHEVDRLIHIMHWFMGALFVGWGVFFVYCLVKFRARSGHTALYQPIKAKVSKYTELGVVAFEAFLLLGLSIPIWASVKQAPVKEDADAVHIRVVAEQFAWNFHYPGPDGIFAPTGVHFIDLATNPVGIDKSHPAGKDDFTSGELRIPKDKSVIVDITSKDVIHSFAVPVLRVKQDAIPGMRIPVWFKATKEGRYQVACAQLCGNNHYKMLAPMVVESQASFEAWATEKARGPEEFEEEDD